MKPDGVLLSVRVFFLCLLIGVTLPGIAQAQGALPLGQSASLGQQKQGQDKVSSKEFQKSLQVVIDTLSHKQSRQALLEQLKTLKQSAQKKENKKGASGSSELNLMGSWLASVFRDSEGQTTDFVWAQQADETLETVGHLIRETEWPQLRDYLGMSLLLLAMGIIVILMLQFVGRRLFQRLGWSLTMPRHPKLAYLAAQCLRRLVPFIVVFCAMYASLQAFEISTAAEATVLIVFFIALCGQFLAAIAEVLVGLFDEGHRHVAARILQARALKPLFLIGALLSLGRIVTGDAFSQWIQLDVTEWFGRAAYLMASVVTAWLMVRMRRPVAHMIRNQSYKRRSQQSMANGVLAVLARLWYLPGLFAIACSVVAILVAESGQVFSRAAVCAVLLLAMLVANALLIRYRNQWIKKHVRGEYKQRLLRFGYVLVAFVAWGVFAEVVLLIWGYSLWGLGEQPGINPIVTRAVFGFGMTILLAWLLWIFADIAITHALLGTSRQSDKTAARAQTVTPMLRKVVFGIILVIAAVVALANLGVNVTPLLAGAGIIGVAIGFGAQNLVQDLITGMFILIEDSIAVGDFIQIGTYMGTVEGLNLRTVKLRDLDAVVHHITYSHIDSIHNMSRDFGIALLKIRVPHDMPIDDAVTLMRETAMELRKEPWIGSLIRSPLEMQGVHSFEDGCPILRMRMRTSPEWQWDVGRAFNQLLKQRMERMEVTLGAPRLTISMAADGGRQYSHNSKSDSVVPDHGDQPQPGGA